MVVDLLVLGGGMAGLTAAARAAASGARVAVVEPSRQLGGSALYAGFVWTVPDDAGMDEVNPDGDPALTRALVAGFPAAVDWVRSLDVQVGPAVTVLRYGRGHQVDVAHYLTRCERLVRENGGQVLLGARPVALRQDGARVTGADVAVDGEDDRLEISSSWTLLATGGFQGSRELRQELIHPLAADIELRGNPDSAGAGLALARAVGGQVGPERAGFYGHLVPYGVALSDPSLFVELALYYSEHAYLFDLTGKRVVDETVGDHLTAMALLEAPEARGLLVADARVYRENMLGSYVEGIEGIDKFEVCRRRGARHAVLEDVDELALVPPEWGYDGPAIRDEMVEVNRLLAAGQDVQPARAHDRRPLTEGPFYVMEATPAITFTMTGVRTDAQARVLDAAGQPVPGLLAAGADAGGLYHRAYAGGLAPAVVFGMAAAATATA